MSIFTTTASVFGLIWAYIFVGCIAHRFAMRFGEKDHWTKDEMAFGTYMIAIFWPIVIGYWAIVLPVKTTLKGTDNLVGFIFSAKEKFASRKNKVNLPVARILK